MTAAPAVSAAPHALEGLVRQLMPLLLRSEAFLEELHLQAIHLEAEGQTEAAGRLFRLVQEQAVASFPRLQSWALFKEAEQDLRAGRTEAARDRLRRVLTLHSGNTKARLLLAPETKPFVAVVGTKPAWPAPGFFVAFNAFDLRLWDYYFGHRRLDALWFLPPLFAVELGPAMLELAIDRHLARDGVVVFALSPDRKLAISRADMLALLAGGDADRFRCALGDRLAVLEAD